MKTTDFLDAVRAHHRLTSDYQLAKFLGIRQQSISRYRNGQSMMDESMCLKIAAALELDPGEVLVAIAIEREKRTEVKSAWQRVAKRLATPALVLLALADVLHNQNVGTTTAYFMAGYTYATKRLRRLTRWLQARRSALWRALALSLALSAPAAAIAGDWSGADTARQLGFESLLAIDCMQTRYGIEHPGQYGESNRLVSGGAAEPSKGRLNIICAGVGLGHYAISRWLTGGEHDSRAAWQYITIGAELYTVANNRWMVGVGISVPL